MQMSKNWPERQLWRKLICSWRCCLHRLLSPVQCSRHLPMPEPPRSSHVLSLNLNHLENASLTSIKKTTTISFTKVAKSTLCILWRSVKKPDYNNFTSYPVRAWPFAWSPTRDDWVPTRIPEEPSLRSFPSSLRFFRNQGTCIARRMSKWGTLWFTLSRFRTKWPANSLSFSVSSV